MIHLSSPRFYSESPTRRWPRKILLISLILVQMHCHCPFLLISNSTCGWVKKLREAFGYGCMTQKGISIGLWWGLVLIHDKWFSSFRIDWGFATKGYVARLQHGPSTRGRNPHELKKLSYDCRHRKWFDIGLLFCDPLEAFDGFPEYGQTPPYVIVAQILEWARELDNWLKDARCVQVWDLMRPIKQRKITWFLSSLLGGVIFGKKSIFCSWWSMLLVFFFVAIIVY